MPPFRHDSLRKQISDYLRSQLNAGVLRPGEMINQKELSDTLGVSRTPLRDTMIQLEVEGLVTIRPCRGVYIRNLSRREIHDIFEVCGALDGLACELAFPYLTAPIIGRLRGLIITTTHQMERQDYSSCNDANEEFHMLLHNYCPNRELVNSLSSLRQRVYNFPYCDPSPAGEWERIVWQEHLHIMELIDAKRPDELGRYVRDVHWRAWGSNEEYLNARFDWVEQ